MSIESGTRPRTSGSPIRLSFAQSSATRTRSETSSGQRRCRSSSGMNAYSCGSGESPWRTMTLSLPSWSNASFAASSDPSASPSGFSCVVRTKRSWARIASTTAATSLAVVWCELINQLGHANPALDRRIVLEGQLRSPLHAEFAGKASLQDRVGGLQTRHGRDSLSFGPENRHEDPGVPQVARRLHAGDGDEADAWILQLPGRLREDLPDGLVD